MTTCNVTTAATLDDWLHDKIGNADRKLVTDHPWAQTYQVSADGQSFYLKVLPECQRGGLPAIAQLGTIFAPLVPRTVAFDVESGFLLLADHGGCDFCRSIRHEDELGLLQTYVKMQVQAARETALLAELPALDLGELTGRFCNYFGDEDEQPDGQVGAAHFLGVDRAQFYHQRLLARASLLAKAVSAAACLPTTLNHCDLRTKNAAMTTDGEFRIFDWDDATAGPAGLSLHNFFSGCSTLVELLREPAHGDERRRELLNGYLQQLVDGGYASRETLAAALPGAACAGVMHYLLSYGKFPLAEPEDREQVAKIFTRRLDDLLIFCDLLAMEDRPTLVRCFEDYEEADAPQHARELLGRYLRTAPHDLEMQTKLGFLLRYLGEEEDAERHCRRILEREPLHADLRYLLGRLLLDRFKLDAAAEQLQLASQFAPQDETIARTFAEVALLRAQERNAASPGCVPTVTCSPEDRAAGQISREKLLLAIRLFHKYGTLVVENVFEPTMLDRLAARFEDQYRSYLTEHGSDDALKVGNRRFMITVDVAEDFNNPSLYAAPLLLPILYGLLGDELILGSFTAVTSLPGAADMRMHKDHPALFSEAEHAGPMPTIGVTTLLPLKGFDLSMGTTRVVKGSHRRSSQDAADMEWQDPCAPKGSCLLMDYRLSHQGLANRSKFVRPVLSMVYNRPWFRDCVNYEQQEPLRISPAEFARVPAECQRLFAWLRPQR